MAKKTKTNRKTSKARTRSTRAQPLLGRADHVRKGKKALAAKEALAAKNALADKKALADKNALADQKASADQIALVDEKAAAAAVTERSRPLAATARLTATYMVLPIALPRAGPHSTFGESKPVLLIRA